MAREAFKRDVVKKRFNELIETDPILVHLKIINQYINHQGESRETRIKEYHVFNDDTVVALREGAMLRVIDNKIQLQGSSGARIFKKGQEPQEFKPGDSLDFLLTKSSTYCCNSLNMKRLGYSVPSIL